MAQEPIEEENTMYRYKNILVSLGSDEHDSDLVSYTRLLSTLCEVDSMLIPIAIDPTVDL